MDRSGSTENVRIAKMIASKLEEELSNELPRLIHHDTRPIAAALEFVLNNMPDLPAAHTKILKGALQKTNDLSESMRESIQKHTQVPVSLLTEMQKDQSLICSDEILNYLVADAFQRIRSALEYARSYEITIIEQLAPLDKPKLVTVNLCELVNQFSDFVKQDHGTKFELQLRYLSPTDSAGEIVLNPLPDIENSNHGLRREVSSVKCLIQDRPRWLKDQVVLYADQFYNRFSSSEMIKAIVDRKLKSINRLGKYDGQTFVNVREFRDHIEDVRKNADYFVNFIDLDGLDKPDKVLQLVAQLGIQENTYIISKHYTHPVFQTTANQQDFRILPFQILESISFEINDEKVVEHRERRDSENPETVKRWLAEHPVVLEPNRRFDCVLVDDSEIIRDLWKNWADKNNIRLLAVSSPKEFHEKDRDVSLNVPIYIDLHLGFDEYKFPISGRDFARNLYKFEYNNLHFCTGEQKEHEKPIYIRSIIGKNPPSIDIDGHVR